MAKNNSDIPVVLFAFTRYKQLAETLRCLKANKVPLLVVFVDGPRNQEDQTSVDKVHKLIDAITWTSVEKHYRQHNQGLSQSIQSGLDQVFQDHDQAIVLEDDVCVAPGFYDYMVSCLKKYKDDERIAGVTGLRYPFAKANLQSDPYDVFTTPRFSSWGWGTWKRQWEQTNFNPEELLRRLDRQAKDFSAGGSDLPYAVNEVRAKRLTGCWDVYFYMNMLLQNRYFVWPKRNFVINNGLTEGSHASEAAPPAWKLTWEAPKHKHSYNLPDEIPKNDKILADFLGFFSSLTNQSEPITTDMTAPKNHKQIRTLVNKVAHRAGFHVSKFQAPHPEPTPDSVTDPTSVVPPAEEDTAKPDPKDYSTTDDPQEVPCQKVAYYHALNQLIKPGAKVLDVGSGLGYGMAILSVGAKEVQGIDVDAKAVKHAKTEYVGNNPKIKNVQKYNGYKTPFNDNEFDVITCIDVLEHVEDYHRFLDELLRISKGYILISTPNQRPEFTNSNGTPKNVWHLREWTPSQLKKIMAKHPQASVEWFYIDGPFEGPFQLKKQPSKDTLVLMPVLRKGK